MNNQKKKREPKKTDNDLRNPKNIYFVEEIDKREAQAISIKNHYLHRKAPCSQAFGLMDREQGDRIVGVLLLGVSASSTLLKGICGPEEAKNVLELSRLWIEDGTPRNTESFFISQAIKRASKQIIVSFADGGSNHVGYVYQATNWLYTGLSAKFKDPFHTGEFKGRHHTGWAHSVKINGKSCLKMNDGTYKPYCKASLEEKFGDELYWGDRPRKHRYVYFNLSDIKIPGDRAKRLGELKVKLEERHKILPYPKKSAI